MHAYLYGVSKSSMECSMECAQISMECNRMSMECNKVLYGVQKYPMECHDHERPTQPIGLRNIREHLTDSPFSQLKPPTYFWLSVLLFWGLFWDCRRVTEANFLRNADLRTEIRLSPYLVSRLTTESKTAKTIYYRK